VLERGDEALQCTGDVAARLQGFARVEREIAEASGEMQQITEFRGRGRTGAAGFSGT
jgi:hypothetical protein